MVRAVATKRTLAQSLNSSAARAAVTRHLNRLRSANNMVQFTAQCHETEAVEMLMAFARDTTLPPGLRRDCCLDILKYARGTPVAWQIDPQTIDPDAPGNSGFQGATIGDEIAAAKLTSSLYKQLNDLVSRNIHPRNWPPEVVAIAGDMVNFYASEDSEKLLLQ